MPQFTKAINPELFNVLSNVSSSQEFIEALNNNVYLITLPDSMSITSFLLNLELKTDKYDYGIAYLDVMEEKNIEHNRNFNAYAFYFNKPANNIINQIIDISDTIYINFIEHPAFNISRTQDFDRFISEDIVLAPVFPDQTDIKLNDVYLPLFPLDITALTLTSVDAIPQNDIYEVRFNNDKKAFMNPSERYNIFADSSNISAFNNSLLDNFLVDPMGMFGNEVKNVSPYLFVTPDQNLATEASSEPFLSIPDELSAIGSSEGHRGLTMATKSYQGNTTPLRYCTLRNKHWGPGGGLTGRYIKISFDLYSLDANTTSVTFTETATDTNNPASDLYLISPGNVLSNCFMEPTASDGQNRPTMMKIYIRDKQCNSVTSALGLSLQETTIHDSVPAWKPNIIQSDDLVAAIPGFVSKKITSGSSLFLLSANFINNFESQFGISFAGIFELHVVDYEYISTCVEAFQIKRGYVQGSNVPGVQNLNDGTYVVFNVRILWE